MSFPEYLGMIEKDVERGNATEHTHRPALKHLIEGLESRTTATNEPKRVECGAPDFVIARGTYLLVKKSHSESGCRACVRNGGILKEIVGAV